MPFTFSHPAAVVPLARRGLPLSALVVGSMAPDFAYFIPLLPTSYHSHTLPDAFLFCVPTGLVVLWLFHTILKYPLLSLLPNGHQALLMPAAKGFSFGPPRQFVLIVVSLTVGALTHLGWDACTHLYGWVGRHFSVLSLPILETAYGALRVYTLLQHSSTLVGGALLCYWYARWYGRAFVRPARLGRSKNAPGGSPRSGAPGDPRFWAGFAALAQAGSARDPARAKLGLLRLSIRLSALVKFAIVLAMGLGAATMAGIYGLLTAFPAMNFYSIQQFVARVVVAGVSVLFVELVLFGIFWHLLKSGRRVLLGRFWQW